MIRQTLCRLRYAGSALFTSPIPGHNPFLRGIVASDKTRPIFNAPEPEVYYVILLQAIIFCSKCLLRNRWEEFLLNRCAVLDCGPRSFLAAAACSRIRNKSIYRTKANSRGERMSRFCLCWRCTRAGMSGDPDVVLLCQAFWVWGDLILIYYWGGLRLAAPMGGGPCSPVLQHLRAVNALVHE